MKQLALASLTLSIAAFASVGSDPCRELSSQVLQPAQSLRSYLRTHPNLDESSGAACLSILKAIPAMPAAASLMRELGARGIENTRSHCTTSVNSIRYQCSERAFGHARCLPEAYSYCGQWEYSVTNQPKYELAMELSTQVDIAYDRAEQLCGLAMERNGEDAAMAAKDLLAYLEERVLPVGDKLSNELSCADTSLSAR